MRTKTTARRHGPFPPPPPRGDSSNAPRRQAAPSPFRSQAHKRFYKNHTRTRPFVQERRLAMENSIFDSLPVTPRARGWRTYAEHPSRCCKNIVREFIANAKTLPETEALDYYVSYVRGRMVKFDPDTIRELMDFPAAAPCHMDEMRRGQYDPIDVLNTVSDGNDSWRLGADNRPKSLKRQHLKPIAMEFLTYILSSIIPSKHCSEVTLDRVFILYIMLTGRYLDLPRILAAEISVCVNSTRAIVLPSLIYKLCLKAGVPDVIEDPFMPGDMLGWRMLNRKKPRMDDANEVEQEEEEMRRRASCSNVGQDTEIIEMLRNMNSNLMRMNSSVEGLQVRMTRLERLGKFWKKQGAAFKRFLLGKKKKSDVPSSSTHREEIARGKQVAEDDNDEESDEDLYPEDTEEIDEAMIEAFVEDDDVISDDDDTDEDDEDDEDELGGGSA